MAFEFSDAKSVRKFNDVKFTPDQEIAVNGLINFINDDFDVNKFVVGLTGAGGVGKTFVTNYIINNCKYSNSVIKCTSPTHKACRVFSQAIGGKNVYTIQSTFGFRLDTNIVNFDPNNPAFKPKSEVKLDDIEVLIVDEASMLNAALVTYIIRICRERQIKLIFIGDASQLPPVGERRSTAFVRCAVVYNLTTIVRQSEDNPIKFLLDLLRNDIKNRTYKFVECISNIVNTENSKQVNEDGIGFEVLNNEEFNDKVIKSFNDKTFSENINKYRLIGYTNACVAHWNNIIRNSIIKGSDLSIITKNDLIMSYETIVDDFLKTIINNSDEYIIHDIVNYVDTKYKLKGFLVRFQKVYGGDITTPLFIIDHNHPFTISMYHKTISELIQAAKSATSGNRSSRWNAYYAFKKKYLLAANILNKNGKIIYNRDIDYGFAITSHRSQGSTYENVFVDINDMLYDKNGKLYTDIDDMLRRLYVACSRCKHNLYLCYGVPKRN